MSGHLFSNLVHHLVGVRMPKKNDDIHHDHLRFVSSFARNNCLFYHQPPPNHQNNSSNCSIVHEFYQRTINDRSSTMGMEINRFVDNDDDSPVVNHRPESSPVTETKRSGRKQSKKHSDRVGCNRKKRAKPWHKQHGIADDVICEEEYSAIIGERTTHADADPIVTECDRADERHAQIDEQKNDNANSERITKRKRRRRNRRRATKETHQNSSRRAHKPTKTTQNRGKSNDRAIDTICRAQTSKLKERTISECDSEDSFIVFEDLSQSFGESTLSDHDDDDDDEKYETNESEVEVVPCKKVRFVNDKDLCTIHKMIKWAFAYQNARKGQWEECARDRERFRRRIHEAARILNYALNADHRARIYRERFELD